MLYENRAFYLLPLNRVKLELDILSITPLISLLHQGW